MDSVIPVIMGFVGNENGRLVLVMKCPACENELLKISVAGVNVLACEAGCGSYWFDTLQIKRLMERLPGAGASLLKTVRRADGVKTFRNNQHICPKCQSTLLYRHCFSRELEMEVDQCSKCGGWWVDVGTLATLESRYSTEADRKQAADDYFIIVFQNKVANMNRVNHDTLEAAQTIVEIFTFLTPPIYLPQKLPIKDY